MCPIFCFSKYGKINNGSIVTYGSEAWVLTIRDEQRINMWERKVLRRIFGAVKDKELWRGRTNKQIMDVYQDKDFVTLIKSHRMR